LEEEKLMHSKEELALVLRLTTGTDWQGLSALLSANAGLISALAAVTAILLYVLLLTIIRVYGDRQDRLTAVARARVQEKQQEVRLLELRLIEQGKLPAVTAPMAQ
jgi:preprotein translocase subunit SecY